MNILGPLRLRPLNDSAQRHAAHTTQRLASRREMRVIHHVPSTDGVTLQVHDHGVLPAHSPLRTCTTVLLAHANGFHGRAFDPVVDALFRGWGGGGGGGDGDGGIRIVTFDFRGHGGSTAPAEQSPSSLHLHQSDGAGARATLHSDGYGRHPLRWGTFAEDVLAVVAHMGIEGCVGVGHSLGGHAVLRAEALRPGTFASVYCFEPIFMVGFVRV